MIYMSRVELCKKGTRNPVFIYGERWLSSKRACCNSNSLTIKTKVLEIDLRLYDVYRVIYVFKSPIGFDYENPVLLEKVKQLRK